MGLLFLSVTVTCRYTAGPTLKSLQLRKSVFRTNRITDFAADCLLNHEFFLVFPDTIIKNWLTPFIHSSSPRNIEDDKYFVAVD